MKRLLLVLGLLLATMTGACAQTTATQPLPVSPKYCILYTLNSGIANTGLRLDYGQDQRKEMAVQDPVLATLALGIQRFTSVAAALSYLDGQGWELVEPTPMPGSGGGYISYLLRRKP